MFQIFSMVVFSILAALIVQTEVYGMLHAVKHASALGCSMLQKVRWGIARYIYASVIWHEIYAVRPVYRIWWPLFQASIVAVLLVVPDVGVALPKWTAIAAAVSYGIGYFAVAYGKSFVAYRRNVGIQQKQGTWEFNTELFDYS